MSNEWHSVCRTCTHGAGEVIPLNSVHNIYSSFGLELVELTTTIGEMLMECANVKVSDCRAASNTVHFFNEFSNHSSSKQMMDCLKTCASNVRRP